ncbi:restriction endonuclease subunit S [Bacillus cereus]|uniref:restriction endonuclease subunit S n=1 Tax=Bacillus cereus group TaxID=86661 RepID=UPI0007784266|nr:MULTISPECIES: restriction endonuclease subunit S [Bacillus cereus group]KXY14131.1 restriction endonuclease subunit S [Bacillus cereus]MDZ4427577.1 restriction endonuclease subunit S [Bacillus cereus]
MKDKRIPDIRFSGFTGYWEQFNLGSIATKIGSGKTPKGGNQNYKSEGIPLLRSQNIFNDKVNFNEVVYITPEIDEDMANSRVQKGDVLLNITGASIGRSAVYKLNHKANVNQHVSIIRPSGGVNPYFIQLNITSEKGQKQIELNQAGGGREGLNFQQIAKMSFYFPDILEQGKIGDFFIQLDNTISLYQKELVILKQTKQGFLQKMFPKEGASVPEFRFPGFTEHWKQHRLDSMVDRLKSYPLSRDVETSDYTGYKYIHYGDIHTKVADRIDKSSDLPNIKAGNYELLEKGDLVLADASEDYKGVAAPAVITIDTPYKLVSGLHTIALRPKKIDSLFLYYFINSPIFRKYGYRIGTGMKVFGISVTNLLKFESTFPSLEEQSKIGKFFEKLDNTIALHQRELDALRETKKAFLQKMFV